ncbi:MAG: prolyl aminopeptidase [Gammaproteobacteria bacterium]|nr:prolyl aminopeptidase [Gammaproteobacteria bacterium]
MLSSYPAIQPYEQHMLSVAEPHQLYVEVCGNPNGMPVLFVHGGPGGGCSEDHRRFFDPNKYRIILFDQRGSGRSTPHADLTENTTQALVSDMEMIRDFLGVDQWVLFGGSWGSTLSLVYAQTYPDRVAGLILRGIFLSRQHDMYWLFNGKGANYVYPDYWEDFTSAVNLNGHSNYIDAYHAVLTGEDEVARMAAAKAWSAWEGRCSSLQLTQDAMQWTSDPHTALSLARIECHYMVNNCFLAPNQILDNMDKIENIPGIIVHGRYDMVCTFENAWRLHKAWPASTLQIIPDAGHSSKESGIIDALVRATQTMIEQIR